MHTIDLSRAPRPQLGPSLAIWLKRTVTGNGPDQTQSEWCLDRVILNTPNFSQDMKFSGNSAILDTLSMAAMESFKSYMPQDTRAFIISAREAAFDLGGLVLQGLTATGQAVERGVQRVFLSFKGVIGGLSSLFLPGRAPDHIGDMECALSTRTLNDVLLPALNLAAAEPIAEFESAQDKVRGFVAKLKEHQEDIAFYTTLLARFVASKEQSAQALALVAPAVTAAIPERAVDRAGGS